MLRVTAGRVVAVGGAVDLKSLFKVSWVASSAVTCPFVLSCLIRAV